MSLGPETLYGKRENEEVEIPTAVEGCQVSETSWSRRGKIKRLEGCANIDQEV